MFTLIEIMITLIEIMITLTEIMSTIIEIMFTLIEKTRACYDLRKKSGKIKRGRLSVIPFLYHNLKSKEKKAGISISSIVSLYFHSMVNLHHWAKVDCTDRNKLHPVFGF